MNYKKPERAYYGIDIKKGKIMSRILDLAKQFEQASKKELESTNEIVHNAIKQHEKNLIEQLQHVESNLAENIKVRKNIIYGRFEYATFGLISFYDKTGRSYYLNMDKIDFFSTDCDITEEFNDKNAKYDVQIHIGKNVFIGKLSDCQDFLNERDDSLIDVIYSYMEAIAKHKYLTAKDFINERLNKIKQPNTNIKE